MIVKFIKFTIADSLGFFFLNSFKEVQRKVKTLYPILNPPFLYFTQKNLIMILKG